MQDQAADNQIDSYRRQLDDFEQSHRRQSREQALRELAALKSQISRNASGHLAQRPGYAGLLESADALEPKLKSLPSELPDPSIFTKLTGGEAWSVADEDPLLGKEVSFRNFKLKPPAGSTIELRTSGVPDASLTWGSHDDGFGVRFTIAALPRSNPRQERPWPLCSPRSSATRPPHNGSSRSKLLMRWLPKGRSAA